MTDWEHTLPPKARKDNFGIKTAFAAIVLIVVAFLIGLVIFGYTSGHSRSPLRGRSDSPTRHLAAATLSPSGTPAPQVSSPPPMSGPAGSISPPGLPYPSGIVTPLATPTQTDPGRASPAPVTGGTIGTPAATSVPAGTATPAPQPVSTPGVPIAVNRVQAASVQGREIIAYVLGSQEPTVMFFGVFHGDEPIGEPMLLNLKGYILKHPELLNRCRVVIVPVLNPDGKVAGRRTNADGVDINRNFDTGNWDGRQPHDRNWGGPRPASEPETRFVLKLITEYSPRCIVSIHAPLHNVNYDGPAAELAARMSHLDHYPIAADIGYETPGSFGTYIGKERQVPIITLEVAEGNAAAAWQQHREALLEAVRFVVGGVHGR